MGAALAAIYQKTSIRFNYANGQARRMANEKPHGRALRRGRYSESGRAYLVTAACMGRHPVFSNARLGTVVAEELKLSDRAGKTSTYAYVVMPDHIHWLFQLCSEESLSSVVRHVKGHSSYRINQLRKSSGAVWQKGFHDRCVRAEESLEDLGNYVILNPVRAGLVEAIDDYPLWDMLWKRHLSRNRG